MYFYFYIDIYENGNSKDVTMELNLKMNVILHYLKR